MSKRTITNLQVDTGQEADGIRRTLPRKETHGAVEDTAEDTAAKEKTAVVSPDELSQQMSTTIGDLITPTSNTETVGDFFSSKDRTPPKDAEKVYLADMIAQVESWLPLEWALLSDEEKLRLSFIILREYPTHLSKFFAIGLAFSLRSLSSRLNIHYSSKEEAVLASLKNDTPCGKRLARLIHKGGDVITTSCCRDTIPDCVKTFEEYLSTRPLWNNSTTSTTIFNQTHQEGQVKPFIRLQEKGSDLCYLIQSSNALYYHLRLRMVRGEGKMKAINLNNARHIRDIYTAELSCKHVFVAFGGHATGTLKDILELGNVGVERDDMLLTLCWQICSNDSDAVFVSLKHMLKTYGPAIVDIPVFEEFQLADRDKFAGDISGKTKLKRLRKHTLLLIGVRKRVEDDTNDGGGYYGLFQNTWKNCPLWIEIGFDLLKSVECCFSFISDQLSFENEFDSGDIHQDMFSQSSMSPPAFTVCEERLATATAMGHGDNNHESDDTDHESGDAKRHTMPSSFNFNPENEEGVFYVIE
jgi:hypothetical protein